ncbi:MAG: tetratricopeptide repeat protein [Deltaproteobacteria bacterium]|nr:tetratricopeptide repeat protein [Deltaproteobacteria bacterium]
MKANAFQQLNVIVATAALLAACTPQKTDTKNAKDVKSQENAIGGLTDSIVPPAAPKRKISENAKVDFKKLTKQYEAATKGKTLDLSTCESLASSFGDLYADHPKVIEAKFNQGALLFECGKLKEAEAVFRDIIAKQPNYGPALNDLGVMALARGQHGAAHDFFRKAARAKNSAGYANVGMLARNSALRGDINTLIKARNNVFRALAVDSRNINAYETLATIIYDHAKTKAKLELARLIAVQAIEREPTHAPLYNLLGLILLKQNEVTRALKQFRKAVSFDNTLRDAHMNIGAITLSFRDYRAAGQAFETVLKASPNKAMKVDATIGLGVALRGQRKFKEAMAKYQVAQGLQPQNDSIAYNMGILVQDYLFDASNPATAIEQLQKALRFLERYVHGSHRLRRRDAKRRIKNIKEMIPMLREQQKMMAEMQKQQGGK